MYPVHPQSVRFLQSLLGLAFRFGKNSDIQINILQILGLKEDVFCETKKPQRQQPWCYLKGLH